MLANRNFRTSFPGFSLLLGERTLVAGCHVEMSINCAAGVGPLDDEILSGVERKFLFQNGA